MLTRRHLVDVPRVPRSAVARLPGGPVSSLKTASGGLRLVRPRRVWSATSQAADASGKKRSGRPWSRRGAVLQQNDEKVSPDVVVTGTRLLVPALNAILAPLEVFTAFSYSSPACCFTAGTLVSTPSGLKAIETLKVGDLVMSRSDKTGETAAKPIVSITPAHERRIWTVTVSYKRENGHWTDERYETTDDHPWRTADNRWVTSAALKHGQMLARESGTAFVVAVVNTMATKLTYNLTIADFHTYFVGKAETWAHNACPSGLRDATKKELMAAAQRNGYQSVEKWKTEDLGLNSRYNIGVSIFTGELIGYPLRGGEWQHTGIYLPNYGRGQP